MEFVQNNWVWILLAGGILWFVVRRIGYGGGRGRC
jgi:hypothetical protein